MPPEEMMLQPEAPTEGMPEGQPVESAGPVPPDVLENLSGQRAGAEAEKERVDMQRSMNESQVESLRREFLAMLFEKMRAAGIDPSDPAQVREMLDMLEEEHPDLARLFEFAFNVLMPEDGSQMSEEAPSEEPAEGMDEMSPAPEEESEPLAAIPEEAPQAL